MNRVTRWLMLLVVVAATPVRADEARVDALLKGEMQKRKIPGLSLTVVRDGQVVLSRGYGLANVEHQAPVKPETVFQLASVTKQFTASGIMLLVEDGKLALEDPVTKHLPDLPASWSGVTVRHLLNHTSGIKSYTSLPSFHEDPRKDYTPKDLIGLVRDLPLEFQPGEKWAYNNTGYYLLGMLIEKVSGKGYDEFLAERIFRPLGMTSTRLNRRDAVIPHRADGYALGPKGLSRAEFVSPTQPYSAGALLSTVEDLAKWDAALYTDQPLKSATRQAMWTATKLSGGGEAGYGLGWSVGNRNGQRMVEHGGGILGFSTQITRFPDLKLTVVVLTNLQGGHAGDLASQVAAVYHPELAPKPVLAIDDKDPKTTERVRKLLVSLAEGKADPEEFTPTLRAALFPDRVKQAQELFTQLGPLNKLELVLHQVQNGLVQRGYRATFGESRVSVNFAFDKDGKIAGAGVSPE